MSRLCQWGPPHRTPLLLLSIAPNGARCAGPVGMTCSGITLSILYLFLPPPFCSSPSPAGASTVVTRPLDAGPLTPAEEGKEKDWVRGKTTTTIPVTQHTIVRAMCCVGLRLSIQLFVQEPFNRIGYLKKYIKLQNFCL